MPSAVRMFQQLKIEVLGIVENMSYFIGDDGKEYDISVVVEPR